MYLLAWIFIGVGVGWGSGRALQGKGYGRMMDILMGVGGAGAGEFSEAFRRLWRFRWAMATTMVGPVPPTVPTAYLNGRRICACQL